MRPYMESVVNATRVAIRYDRESTGGERFEEETRR